MDTENKQPYMLKFDELGPMTVWIVDGGYVRARLDPNFTNFGQPHHFDCIPAHEFWLDQGGEDEYGFFLDHLWVEWSLMDQGASYEDALAAADKLEHRERHRAGDMAWVAPNEPVDAALLHDYLWGTTTDGVKVYVVRGRLVRVIDSDFTAGGHALVYSYIPKDEVWIDDAVVPEDRPFDLYHELLECRRMDQEGLSYRVAHAYAIRKELYYRQHPEELADALKEEGWE